MKLIFCLLLFGISVTGFSQDTTRVDQYCEVIATGKVLGNKLSIDIDYGEEKSIWKDRRLKDEEGKSKKFSSVVDVLNFLGKSGWKLVSAFPIIETSGRKTYHYVFKRELLKSETD